MRRYISTGFSKHLFLTLMALAFLLQQSIAQDFTVGTGTTGNDPTSFPSPLAGNLEGSRSQYLFRASELQAAGITRGYITGLKINVLSVNDCFGFSQYSVKMGATTTTSLSATAWEPTPIQFYSTDYLSPVEGVNELPFSDKFFWNGTSNILIEICINNYSRFFDNQSFNPTVAWTTGLSFNASHTNGANNVSNYCTRTTATEIGTATTRPNLTFSWSAAPPDCAGVPTGGTATSSSVAVCPDEPFKLTLNAPTAIGLTYQWQSSADNVTWTDIDGAIKDTFTTALTTATYYRNMINCTVSGQSAPSASIQVAIAPPVSGTFTINNSLANPGVGQFKTFTEAFNFIKCGINNPVVFNVVNTGTPYTEQLVMTQVPGASTKNTITFNGNGAIINYLSSDYDNRAVIKFNGADHVTIDSLNITALGNSSSDYGFGIQFTNNSDSNLVKRCKITVYADDNSSNYCGVVFSGGSSATAWGSYCDANTLDKNTIIGGGYGISMVGGTPDYTDYPVSNNKITNNIIKDFYEYGIYLTNTALTLIEGNDISRPNRVSNPTTTYGISVSQTNVATSISKNRIHAFFDSNLETTDEFYGISLSNADTEIGLEHVISNNLIYDIKGLGTLYGIRNMGSNAVNIYYNTISFDDHTSASLEPTYGYYSTFMTAAVNIKNNTFSLSRGGAGLKYAIYMDDNDFSLYEVNYNNFFNNGHPTVNTGFFKGNTITTLANWKTATGFDANSVEVDPGFKDAAAGNFLPTSAAFENLGFPVSVTDDITGIARSTTKPDIGAYEYNLASCNTSFVAGDAFSSVGLATCVNKTVQLNLKNNDVGLGLTYQWQTATTTTGTWTDLSTPLIAPPYSFTTGNDALYYRAAVSCNGGTPIYSSSIQINIGGLFPAGTYTIDKTQPSDPAGSRNFNSFKDAVAAINCGIAGAIVFNVKPDTYTEQIRIASIPNSSAINTITFQSESGTPANTVLTYDATSANTNYVVRLDSASNFIFKNLTIASTNEAYGRTFDILSIASNDSILNNVIAAPIPGASYADWGVDQTTSAGVHAATNFRGGNLVIKGNTFKKGAKGVYIVGVSPTSFTKNNVIENNVFDSVYHQSIYTQNASNTIIRNNTIPVNTTYSTENYNAGVFGIYTNNCDSGIVITGNNITLKDNVGYVYGIYMSGNDATAVKRGLIANNKVVALEGLTSQLTGIHSNDVSFLDIKNNEVSISSSIAGDVNYTYAAALFIGNSFSSNFYNNTLLNTSPEPGIYNVAMYVDQQYARGAGATNIMNNIIANKGGGPAVFYNYTAEHVQSDYNLLYSSGSLLVKQGPTDGSFEKEFADIAAWRAQYGVDMNSIVYDPALTSNTDLRPLASNAGSWALQGRGTQVVGNNTDKTGAARSETLTDGVPDLGAYEFLPTVAPPALTAIPASPAANTRQVFLMGSDTVTAIKWGGSVPSSITLKRYSGVLPAGLAATEQSLYYYVDADATGGGNYKYDVQQFFIDPWLRTLPIKSYIKLGKTDAANAWSASAGSHIDSLSNIISDTALSFIDKFTGMTDGKTTEPPVYVTTADSTNKGTRFWAPYGLNRDALQGNGQQFRFILAADSATEVTVRVNGTAYSKTYSVPAGGIITTDEIPKSGLYDARLREEGLSHRGILIESKQPISASVFLDMSGTKTALLMPTGTYGKSYVTLGARQFSGYPQPIMGTSWVNVVADNDNTVVEITPSGNTVGGKVANTAFRVTLNRGDVYQILGDYITMRTAAETGGLDNSYESYDLTGTKVVAVPNAAGVCQPVGVFAGSSGTGIRCEQYQNGADQYVFQQSYPDQAWGKYYLTAPFASANSKNEHLFNIFRVLVKDAGTVVKRNGVTMTNLTGNFYEFSSRAPEYIEADKPVMVAQMMTYFTACGNDEYDNPGSNEAMFYLTPLGHGIKKASFYTKAAPYTYFELTNYVTVIIPTQGLASLKIGGESTFDSTYTHPNKAGYTVVMKKYGNVDAVVSIESDTTFTANVHSPHNVYGFVYNVGYQVPRVNFTNKSIHNVNSASATPNTYTCVGTPFRATVYLPVIAKTLVWKLSNIAGITPAADVTETSPVPVDTVEINFRDYYVYTLAQNLSISATGTYHIPVTATYAASGSGCDNTISDSVRVEVISAPVVDYTSSYTGCINASATFTGTGTAGNGAVIDKWSYNFGDNTTANTQNATKQWQATGTYDVALTATANDGCVGSVTKPITVNALPTLAIVNDNQGICPDSSVTFEIATPATGVTYNWYNQATGGTLLGTGSTYTAVNLPGATTIYASATQNGCDIATRVPVTVFIIPSVQAPTVTVDSLGVRSVKFRWSAVSNATGYEVSTDGGTTWTVPSSGATGLTHTITGLNPSQTVSLQVRGLGGCVQNVSAAVQATTLTDDVFIPNSFTPNGDGVNDIFRVYGNDVRELRLIVFNQWGQKLFETSTTGTGWDGKQNGKLQPTGVYMYVARIVLVSGQELNRKGSINLIR
jgi:gliding motility-associated-like protein